jgi:hypothetical protein
MSNGKRPRPEHTAETIGIYHYYDYNCLKYLLFLFSGGYDK